MGIQHPATVLWWNLFPAFTQPVSDIVTRFFPAAGGMPNATVSGTNASKAPKTGKMGHGRVRASRWKRDASRLAPGCQGLNLLGNGKSEASYLLKVLLTLWQASSIVSRWPVLRSSLFCPYSIEAKSEPSALQYGWYTTVKIDNSRRKMTTAVKLRGV